MPFQGDGDEQLLYHDSTRVSLQAHWCHGKYSLQAAPEGSFFSATDQPDRVLLLKSTVLDHVEPNTLP